MKQPERSLHIACKLSDPREVSDRKKLLGSVFAEVRWVEELEDGYTFGFPGSTEWAENLVRIVNAERACCPFLTFDIHFEPENGPISLRVTGPEDAKAFIEAELMSSRSV